MQCPAVDMILIFSFAVLSLALAMEGMSVAEVGNWLRSKGFSDEVAECFSGKLLLL